MDQLKNRKINIKIILVIIAFIVIGAWLAATVGSLKTSPELKEAGYTALKSGTGTVVKDEMRKQRLVIAVDTIDGCLNPAFATAMADRMACEMIYEPLAKVHTDGSFEPVLAEQIDWDPEKQMMTIKLKQGISFSDGTPLTADDVCASIGIKCLAEYNMDTDSAYFHIEGVWDMNEQKTQGISGIRKVDENTVELVFMDVNRRNWDILETSIQKNRFADIGQQLTAFRNLPEIYSTGIGTGPYMADTISQGINICLQANPEYRGEMKDIKSVELAQINFYNMKEAIENQEIDVAQYTANSEQFDNLYQGKQFNVYAKPTDNIYAIGFNLNNIFLKDERVRQAVAYAFNKEGALNKDWEMKIAPTNVIGYGSGLNTEALEVNAVSYDKGKAESILKEAGMKDRIILRLPVLKENEFQMHLASCLKKDLEAVGFSVEVNECTSEEYVQALYVEDKFDIYLFNDTMNYDWDTFQNMSRLRDGMPVAFLDNDYVELVSRLEMSMNQEEYAAALTELSSKFYEKMPVVPFGRVQRYLSISHDLSGYGASPDALMLENVNLIQSDAK